MRRTASQVLRQLEMRVARLENQSALGTSARRANDNTEQAVINALQNVASRYDGEFDRGAHPYFYITDDIIFSVFYDASRKTLTASFSKNGKVDQRASLNTSDMSTREVVAEALAMLKKHIKGTPNL